MPKERSKCDDKNAVGDEETVQCKVVDQIITVPFDYAQ